MSRQIACVGAMSKLLVLHMCDETAILGEGCESWGLAHEPYFYQMSRDSHTKRFTGSIWLCDRCEHRLTVSHV